MGFLNSRSPQFRRLATVAASGGVVAFSFAFGFVTVTLLVVLGFIPASVQAVSVPELAENPPALPAPETTTDTPPTSPEAELLADALLELKAAQSDLQAAKEALVSRDESLASLQARIESLTGQLAETHQEFARLETSLAAFEAEKAKEKRAKRNRPKESPVETATPSVPVGEEGEKPETVATTDPVPSVGAPSPEPETPEASSPPPTPGPTAAPEIAPILYDKGSAVNFEDRDRVVREVKAALDTHPEATIRLTGHADDSPHAQTNLDISRNRANFLAAYLRQSGGVPPEQIEAEAVGDTESESEPTESNRRVEILVQP